MPTKNSWLDALTGMMAEFDAKSSLGSMQKQLDEVEFKKNPLAWSVAKPVSLGIDALSQIGRPIAALGGAIGANESEAGVEARARGEDTAGMALEGARQGWEEGDDTLKETITALDVLSAGAGAGAGLAAKGSRAASALTKLDLGATGADFALGGGNVYQGVRDDDMAKVATGVARMAGNAYGGVKALKELGVKGYADAVEVNAGANPNHSGITDIPHVLKGQDAEGAEFSWFRSDKMGRDAMRQQTQDIERIMANPEARESYAGLATLSRRIDAELANEELGNLSKAVDESVARGPEIGMEIKDKVAPEPWQLFKRTGDFMGFTGDETVTGKTFVQPGVRSGRLGQGQNGYVVNPRVIAENAHNQLNRLLNGQFDPAEFDQIMYGRPAIVRDYVLSVREGGPRTPEMDLKVGSELFIQDYFYTTLHEGWNHTPVDSMHNAPHQDLSPRTGIMGHKAPAYQTSAIDTSTTIPGVVGRHDLPKPLMKGENIDSYSALNNESFRIMQDPERLKGVKALMNSEYMKTQFQKWYADALPLHASRAARDMKVAKRADRVVGRAEAKVAATEIANQRIDAPPPTPPGPVPPGAPSGEPQGPQLESLGTRIKNALKEHQRAVNQNQLKMAEVNAHRADMLRKNEEAFFQQRIDSDEFALESKRIMSGDYDLIKQVDPLVVQGGDVATFMQKIAAQANDDAFKRQRAQIAFDKVVKGQRLEDNEIVLLREVLNDRTESAKNEPFIKKLGQFFQDAIGFPRALMTAYDLSAAGRQGLYGSVMNPGAAKEAFKTQIKALMMTRPEFESMMLRLQDPAFNPYAEISKAAGLHFSESMAKDNPKTVEEAFMHGKFAEALPGVRRTEQAYIAYLNKLRVELFNKHLRVMEQAGEVLFDADMGVSQKVKDLAYMVNTLTGRGELSLFHMSPNSPMGKKLGLTEELAPGKKSMDKAHEALTTVFFAPRFAASRAALMRDTVQAMIGGGLDPAISKVYMKNVIGTVTAMTSVAAGLASMGVGTFNSDPRKKDFGVLKVGKTRYDLYGGLKQWAKIVSLIGQDEYFSGRSRVPKRYGSGPMAKTKTGELGRFAKSKFSPMAGFIVEAMTGEDFMGRKSSLWQNAYGHTVPMIAQTIVELYNEDELDQLPFAVPASVVGLGVNTYSERRFNKRDR